jgi:putative methyltransferase
VRINTLKTTLEKELSSTFAGYEEEKELLRVMSAPGSAKIYFVDPHIPNLLALPPKVDLSKTAAYTTGRIIFQDKASCFPAYLLDPKPEDGDIIDGCAAPGNKTTHSAAILSGRLSKSEREDMTHRVIAFERDKFRTKTLEKMVKLASADQIVCIKGGCDFLDAKPGAEEFANVGCILLDPSCSGTGIVGRDDAITMHLPDPQASVSSGTKAAAGKKRKRNGKEKAEPKTETLLQMNVDDTEAEEIPAVEDKLAERLTALSTFQLRILTHAMKFPKARRITYSTCSIHFEENEGVVFQALASSVAKQYGWKILRREDQVSGMRNWTRRGVWEDGKLSSKVEVPAQKEAILDACIRCDKATEEGTMGFFVAAFVRDESAISEATAPSPDAQDAEEVEEVDGEDEWEGFSGDEQEEPIKPERISPERKSVPQPKHSRHVFKKQRKRK